MRKERLFGKLSKCEFWVDRKNLLGNIVFGEEIPVDPMKSKQ